MSAISRRKLITTGLAAVAGATGLDAAARLAGRFGLIPPDAGTLFGAGAALTYGVQRLLTRNARAREFARSEISKHPFANTVAPLGDGFGRLARAGFVDWRLTVDGLVARPASFSLAELRGFPASREITLIACEEGWSYIAEWSGVPLAFVLHRVGLLPGARFIVYRSIQSDWWDSLDLDDAWHPQTLLTLGMNGSGIPVPFGGPLRLRVPRQLGYKSVKYITHLTATDDIRKVGTGMGSSSPETGYAWYAGI